MASKKEILDNLHRYSQSFRCRVALAIVLTAMMMFIIIVLKSTSKSQQSAETPTVSDLISNYVQPNDTIWEGITVRDEVPSGNWSQSGVVFTWSLKRKQWFNMDIICQVQNLIPMSFATPGGTIYMFIYGDTDMNVFHHAVKQTLTPILILAASDPDIVFIDIGAEVGMTSLTVASLGNRVLALEPYGKNIPKLCNSIKDSGLAGRMYVVFNAIREENTLLKINPGTGKNKMPNYMLSDKKNRKGNVTTSIKLVDLLEQFPMEKAGLRISNHDNVTETLLGCVEVFAEVDVVFVQVKWFSILSMRCEEFVLDFLQQRLFQPYGYWAEFTFLDDDRILEWPDNVIFVRDTFMTYLDR